MRQGEKREGAEGGREDEKTKKQNLIIWARK